MTQDQLDLCALGMTIARMQLKAMAATSIALGNELTSKEFVQLETEMSELATQIQTGEIRGSDTGQA